MPYYAGDSLPALARIDHDGEILTFPDYSLSELEEMPTLSQGQADDLKLDDGRERVWLSRCTMADGEPCNNKVTIEHLIDGRWIEAGVYQARD